MIISRVIRQHGYTIEQVAEKMGLKRGSLANTIGGNPTADTIQKIAAAIGCKCSEFFVDVDGEPVAPTTPIASHICPHCGKPIEIELK